MPDQIIRDIPTIARYARRNENEDLRFRAYLKGRLEASNAQLDGVVRETTDAVWKQIDCTACANCCKTLQIVVDNKDIARLAAHVGSSVRDFTRRYIGVADDKSKYFNATPCPFLGADNRCTVYEHRPQACRDYPYLHEAHFRSRTLSMIENAASCPIVFNVWDSLKQQYKPKKQR